MAHCLALPCRGLGVQRQPGDDLVQHRLQRLVGWRGHFDEDRFAFGVAPVHAVQHQAVKVDVEREPL